MRDCIYYLGGGYKREKEKGSFMDYKQLLHNAYKQLNTWYDLCGPQLQRPSFWASICKEIQEMFGQTLWVIFSFPLQGEYPQLCNFID